MDCYLIIGGVERGIFTLEEVEKFMEFISLRRKRTHYEVIKCVRTKEAFFITGRKGTII